MAKWHVGQEVYHGGAGMVRERMTTVTRVTGNSVECADGTKWTLSGRKWGSSRERWNFAFLHPLNADTKARIVRETRIRDARAAVRELSDRASNLDDPDKLERVVAAMREALGEDADG